MSNSSDFVDSIRGIYAYDVQAFRHEAFKMAFQFNKILVPDIGSISSPWVQLLQEIPNIGRDMIVPLFVYHKFSNLGEEKPTFNELNDDEVWEKYGFVYKVRTSKRWKVARELYEADKTAYHHVLSCK